MQIIKDANGTICGYSIDSQIHELNVEHLPVDMKDTKNWQSSWDWETLEHVEKIVETLNLKSDTKFMAIDRGTGSISRYDIIIAPQIGDKVSYAFNGDYYPDGVIVKITKTFRIKTSGGHTYTRQKQTGKWVMVGSTWSLVAGHVSKLNQEF